MKIRNTWKVSRINIGRIIEFVFRVKLWRIAILTIGNILEFAGLDMSKNIKISRHLDIL